MKDRIMKYLAAGVAAKDVCKICGITPSYISQLLADDNFKSELEEKITKMPASEEDTQLVTKYTAMEHKLLSAMDGALANAELPAITNALREIGRRADQMHLRKNPVPVNGIAGINGTVNNITYVSLTLPAHQVRKNASNIVMNNAQEVIAIGNETLAPMPSSSVKAMFEAIRNKKEVEMEVIENGTSPGTERKFAESEIPADF